jgi:hypothetical protein
MAGADTGPPWNGSASEDGNFTHKKKGGREAALFAEDSAERYPQVISRPRIVVLEFANLSTSIPIRRTIV